MLRVTSQANMYNHSIGLGAPAIIFSRFLSFAVQQTVERMSLKYTIIQHNIIRFTMRQYKKKKRACTHSTVHQEKN